MGNDLEIEILAGSAPGTYEVRVDSPAGTATGTMVLDTAAILGRRRELAASVLASAATSRSTFSTLERPVRDVGHSLFEALFAGRIYGRYTASMQQAGSQGEPLRVVLRLRAPELAGIPWETLFDPESGEYLCQREPVVRYVEAAQPSAPLTAAGPLRILGMVAAPADLPTLDTAEERRRLDDALGELCEQGLVEMVWVESGHWSALQQQLVAGPWHVLHVIAHGGVDAQGGVLALEDERSGNAAHVGAQRFARLLHACRPVPRLVVLNACSSGESAADDLLSSTAAALVHSGISAAVAMQFAVTDPAALAFSRGFYQALARNIAVDEAVRLGRIAIDGTSEQTLEWVTPVVYLRTEDTRLFELTSQPAAPAARSRVEGQERQIADEAARHGLYVQARASARKERYDEAVALLDSLLTLDPTYRDAAALRDQVRRQQRLGASYAEARSAEESGDWERAARHYRSVVDADPDHRDALARCEAAERHVSIAGLQDELRVHAAAGDWGDVLAVSAELARLDPDAADPDGLATRARERTDPVQPVDPGRRSRVKWVAGIGAPLVVLAGLAVWWLGGGEEPGGPPAGRGDGSQTTAGVTCWDGGSADTAAGCPTPQGRDGLASVFPSMDDRCSEVAPQVEGKLEIWECVYDAYTVRYSRWQRGYDRYSYFDETNPDATTGDWRIGGQKVGRTWVAVDDRATETRLYRWLASYRSAPYEVLVKGEDEEARDAGRATIEAKPPDQIGLP